MAYRRDWFGHFIRRGQPAQRPCTHACCRGYRVHPENLPVIPANRQLRRATDTQLEEHYRKLADIDTPQARRGEAQVLHELERRDRADQRRQATEQRRRQRWEAKTVTRAAARMDREAETERIRLEAEAVTRGYLVNKKGRARGINSEEILTGREAVFQRYASDEARDYFRNHPRPTAAYFRGADTRMIERYR